MSADFRECSVPRYELERYGVTDLATRPGAPPMPLPEPLVTSLIPLLLREGFDLDRPILVRESPDRHDVILRQQIEGSAHD